MLGLLIPGSWAASCNHQWCCDAWYGRTVRGPHSGNDCSLLSRDWREQRSCECYSGRVGLAKPRTILEKINANDRFYSCFE